MNSKEYKCNICNKMYVSYKSLQNHNKKFHKTEDRSNVNNNVNINLENVNNVNNIKDNKNIYISLKIIKCEKCYSIFSSRQAKYLHKKNM